MGMSIGVENPRVEYVGNGVTTSFPVPYTYDEEDLTILLGDEQVFDGFTITDNGVDFDVAPEDTVSVVILRNTPLDQRVNFDDPQRLSTEEIVEVLNRGVRQVQDLSRDLGSLDLDEARRSAESSQESANEARASANESLASANSSRESADSAGGAAQRANDAEGSIQTRIADVEQIVSEVRAVMVIEITEDTTLDTTFQNKLIRVNSTEDIVITLPANDPLMTAAFVCNVTRIGSGAVTFEGDSGVVIDAAGLRIFNRFYGNAVHFISSNRFQIYGDLY